MQDDQSLKFDSYTLPSLLRQWALTRPDLLALREKKFGIWNRVTFREYYERMADFALGLDSLGFSGSDFLAVASDNTPEWFYADLATQALGSACIGIYPTNPWPELKYILAHSGASVVVCGDQEQTDKVLSALADGDGLPALKHIICVDMKGMRQYDHPMLKSFADVAALGRTRRQAGDELVEQRIAALEPDAVAVIVYTSGTTGMPKGAMLSHRGLIAGARALCQTHGITEKTWSVVAYLPLCHVAERSFSTVIQLVNGTVVSFAESIDTVLCDLREVAPKGFVGVPRIWEKLQSTLTVRMLDTRPLPRWIVERAIDIGKDIAGRRLANGGAFESVRDRLVFAFFWVICYRSMQKWLGLNRATGRMFSGGAPISPEVLKFYWAIGLKVFQIYGMTETSGLTNSQYEGSTEHGSCGPPVPGCEQVIAEDGEILIRCSSLFRGYLRNEEASQEALQGGWLHTGDIGKIGPDGSLFITDRKKDILITSGGKNITPSLIENRIKDSKYISEAILLGDGRHFVSALIQIDYETVGKWAQGKGISYTNYKSLAANDQVQALIATEIETFNQEFARVENVRKFRILTKELDHDDGEVTATMKVRRKAIERIFAEEIKAIYG